MDSITVDQTRHNEDMNTIVMAVEILKRRLVMLEVVSEGHDAWFNKGGKEESKEKDFELFNLDEWDNL